MATIRVDFRFDRQRLQGIDQKLDAALKRAVKDCMDDLARTSSEAAPHDKGILEKSYTKEVKKVGNSYEGTVEYSVRERSSSGSNNYAMKMHEGSYNLGAGSLAKPGGRGMSGKTYRVGNKFLERPLDGETQEYKKHIEKELKKEFE